LDEQKLIAWKQREARKKKMDRTRKMLEATKPVTS